MATDDELIGIFLDEAESQLELLNSGLMRLESEHEGGAAHGSDELIQSLFRSFHSIKGASGMFGLVTINRLTHVGETLLASLRDREKTLNDRRIRALFSAVDGLTRLLAALRAGTPDSENVDTIITELEAAHREEGTPAAEPVVAVPTIDMAKYLPAFLDDVGAALGALETGLLTLEGSLTASNGTVPAETINELFRSAHQIKGLSGSMGYRALNELTHAMENLLDGIRGLRIVVSAESTSALLEGTDRIRFIVQKIQLGENPEIDLSTILAKLRPLAGMRVDTVDDATRLEEQLRAALFNDKHPAAAVAAPAPQVDVAKPRETSAPQTMRVDVDRLDDLMNMSGELVVQKAHFLQLSQRLKAMADVKNLATRLETLTADFRALTESGDAKSIPAASLGNILRELEWLTASTTPLRTARETYQDFTEAMHQMDLTSREIQRNVMSIRMVPVGPLFGRFRRVVRDLSKDLAKDVTIVLKGEDTEVDKRVADDLGDPLTHIVRNAVDHGLESADDRQAAGKPRQGTVTLNAFHRGNRIHVVVTDDGRGIDAKKLKKKAAEKGIHSGEVLEKMTDREAVNLIFHPGFSTAAQVTNVSGRGVGMDIVRKKIEELNGVVEIDTVVGQGTTFTISLPLTLAIQKSLICEMNGSTFAIPLDAVFEIVDSSVVSHHGVGGNAVVRLRDRVIPVRRIGDLLHGMGSATDPGRILVVTGVGANRMALEVNRLLGEEDIVVKSLAKNLGDVSGVSGVSILGSGKIALILDIAKLLESERPTTTDGYGAVA